LYIWHILIKKARSFPCPQQFLVKSTIAAGHFKALTLDSQPPQSPTAHLLWGIHEINPIGMVGITIISRISQRWFINPTL
jgi:hypothetical protein